MTSKKKSKKNRKLAKAKKKILKASKKNSSKKKNLKLQKAQIKKTKEEAIHRPKIRIIGIGGGAGSIISEISREVKRTDFVVANTDYKALKALPKNIKKVQFGQSLTRGLGTGMNDELGELAAQQEKEKIKRLLEGQDLCIIVSCLGGGTSSGAAPVFAKISKELGILTYGIFTLPFDFEGKKKREIALRSLEKTKGYLNAYSVIPNERVFKIINKDTPLKEALSAINKKLADNLEGLLEIIYLPGLINIDFADLRTVLEGRGRLSYLNSITIENLEKESAIKKIISSPLYPYTLKGARAILYNIVSEKDLQLLEVSYISKVISELVNKKAKIIFGISYDKKFKNKIKITLFATGCTAKNIITRPEELEKQSLSKKPEIKELPRKPEEGKKKSVVSDKKKKKKTKPKPAKKTKKISLPFPLSKKEPKEEEIKVEVRRNGLQLKKAIEEVEKELLEEEKKWEIPAIFRKKEK